MIAVKLKNSSSKRALAAQGFVVDDFWGDFGDYFAVDTTNRKIAVKGLTLENWQKFQGIFDFEDIKLLEVGVDPNNREHRERSNAHLSVAIARGSSLSDFRTVNIDLGFGCPLPCISKLSELGVPDPKGGDLMYEDE